MWRLKPYITCRLAVFSLLILSALAGLVGLWQQRQPGVERQPAATLPNAAGGKKAINYLKEQGLYASLGEAMQRARYSVTAITNAPAFVGAGEVWQAANPAQQYSVFFTSNGVHLAAQHNRDSANGWHVGLHLQGIGYGENVQPVAAGTAPAANARFEIVRTVDGASEFTNAESGKAEMVEWYENRAGGLEQGFTLTAPPGNRPVTIDTRLRLVMQVSGALQAQASNDTRALQFINQQRDGFELHRLNGQRRKRTRVTRPNAMRSEQRDYRSRG